MENLESGIGLEKVGHWRCALRGDIGTLSCSFLSLLPGHPEKNSIPLMHACFLCDALPHSGARSNQAKGP